MELLDGSRLISKDKRALSDADAGHGHQAGVHEEESGGGARHARSVNVHEAGFIQYLDTGIWHLAFYNDGRNTEQVSYNTIVIGKKNICKKKKSLLTIDESLILHSLFISASYSDSTS